MKTVYNYGLRISVLKHVFLLASWFVFLGANANIYTVTNTNNSGSGSLRQAILDANANLGTDIIQFNISTSGNYFESSGGNSWPVILVNSALPPITDPVLIDGFTQADNNTGAATGNTVGADNYLQADINYPDVYITPSNSFSFSSSYNNITYDGLVINTTNTTIRGICISGFGNTNSNSSRASIQADIVIVRSNTPVYAGIDINNCFISCDPRGNYPSNSKRQTKGDGILIMGNVFAGSITNNYIAYPGTYAIHFNGGFDPLGVGPSNQNLQNRDWTITENQIYSVGSSTYVTSAKAADGVNLMHCRRFSVMYNYIEDVEQVGIDIGYNADSNYVANNSLTGFTNTTAAPPLAGIRIGLDSQGDSLVKNHIYDNSGSTFKAGIWIDRSGINTSGVTVQDNINNYVGQNIIHDNNASGIVMSDYIGAVNARYNTFSQNSIYNNAGLGIDLGYSGTSDNTKVNPNDDGDSDNGVNDLQNFPLIDSVKLSSLSSYVTIWGKAPPGSTIEFFGGDGNWNKHNSPSPMNLNYGEGKTYIGTGVEGSVDDGASGTGSYAIDGNVATSNVNLFRFSFLNPGAIGSLDSLTATATVNKSTSEFGPISIVEVVLGCSLFDLSGLYADNRTKLIWSAICDDAFNYFIVERSNDGLEFTSLGQVNSIPGDYDGSAFDYTDYYPVAGINYYRLKMINKDGAFKYSKVIKINTGIKNSLTVSPNPFASEINLSLQVKNDGDINVRILSSSGKVVMTQKLRGAKGMNVFNINDLERLPRGYYIMEVNYDNITVSEKIVRD